MQDDTPFPTLFELMKHQDRTTWDNFEIVIANTLEREKKINKALKQEGLERPIDADSSLVLCGSFARYEIVNESDCDWTLLINGVVNNRHAKNALEIKRALDKAFNAPGSTGTFGNLIFSHDLVHRIGGGSDSNENLTRRLLMLLESRPLKLDDSALSSSSQLIWNGVLKNILERYFEEDVHFSPDTSRVPRFLLNDITRLWRTICVDYAAKFREQGGKKWAIRNAKLRFSRKLLYASGLAFCYRCHLDEELEKNFEKTSNIIPFITHASEFAQTPSLEYLAQFIKKFAPDRSQEICRSLFGPYNGWLGILNSDEKRRKLESLDEKSAYDDSVFKEIQKLSEQFSSGLKLLFFAQDNHSDRVADLSLKYATF